MTLHSLTIAYSELSAAELSSADQELLAFARQAGTTAYAPYSHFHVGAALRLESGEIITGCNQENAAYPSGLCAERVALFSASSQRPGVPVTSLAIVADTKEFKVLHPVTPCGGCRQVMAEYEGLSGKPLRVIMQGGNGTVWVVEGVNNLLPLMFQGDQLKK